METWEQNGISDEELVEWTGCDEPPYVDVGQISPRQVGEVLSRVVAGANESDDTHEWYQAHVATTMAAVSGFDEAVPVLLLAADSKEGGTRAVAVHNFRRFISSGPGLRTAEGEELSDEVTERVRDRAILENWLVSKAIQIRDTDPRYDVQVHAKKFLNKLHGREQ